jgi:RNA polymerase sigma-70 factor (ECF subfamily)
MIVNTASRTDVYAECAQELTRFATSLVGPTHAADVVSEAVIRAMWSEQWDGVSNRRAYLYKAVLNQSKMHHRATARRRRREASAARPATATDATANVDVWQALGTLSVLQRALVFLTYWEDWPCTDIAARFGMTERTVRRQLAKARRRLGEVLDDRA